MKYLLFWGIALLLAATAAAQPQNRELSVMRMADPDLYLQLKQRTAPAPPAEPAPAEQAVGSSISITAERDYMAEYLLGLAALETCCPDKFAEEMQYLYTYMGKGPTPLTPEQLEYLILARRLREYVAEK